MREVGAGAAVLAWDVVFNREVLGDAGVYFSDPDQLRVALESAEADEPAQRVQGERAKREVKRYDWDDVALRYEELARRLPDRRRAGDRQSGRRLRRAAA